MNSAIDRHAHLSPIVLRVALAIVFIVHGLPKLTSPGNFVGFFGHIGLPLPSLMVLVVGLVETLGGLALLVGKGIRPAAALLAADMLGAIVVAKRSMGFLNGWEFDFVLLASCLALALSRSLGQEQARDGRKSADA